MKPAFHRSPVLWLGFFVLIFLGWLWGDARKATTSFYEFVMVDDSRSSALPTDPIRYGAIYVNGVTLHDGMLLLSYARVVEVRPPAVMRRGGFSWIRTAPGYPWQVPALGALSRLDAADLATVRVYQARVPMWGVIAGFAVVWGGLLAWRWRRATRMMAAARDERGPCV